MHYALITRGKIAYDHNTLSPSTKHTLETIRSFRFKLYADIRESCKGSFNKLT